MAAHPRPAAEVDVDEVLVRALLADQHPDLADEPQRLLASGWDNVNYRLGDELIVRLPRRQMAASLVRNEQRWLPELAPRLPLPIPAPVRIGRPALGYPWAWSVNPYFPGSTAAVEPPEPTEATAEALGEFLAALHRPAPPAAPHNPFRGRPLADRDEAFRQNAEALPDRVAADRVLNHWDDLLDVPTAAEPAVWVHGDLHLGNMITRDGSITAVVDFGDITAGDRATDLAIGWMLFQPQERATFRAAAGVADDATWRRGLGWALHFAIVYLAHSADTPWMHAMGEGLLASVLDELE